MRGLFSGVPPAQNSTPGSTQSDSTYPTDHAIISFGLQQCVVGTHATTTATNHIALKGSHLRPAHKLSTFEISILRVSIPKMCCSGLKPV